MPILYAIKKDGLYLSGLLPKVKFEEDEPRFDRTYFYRTEAIANDVARNLKAEAIRCSYEPREDGTLCGKLTPQG